MTQYPSISNKWRPGHYWIYNKLDGSNIRVEWNRKNGFHKWGRRHGLLDDSNPILKRAPPLFMERYSEELAKILRDQRTDEATFFFEFYGLNSFAGNHVESEIQTVTLFDAHFYKKGFLNPREFENLFRDKVPLPAVRVGSIGANSIEEMVNETDHEGYVLKAASYVFKVKTKWWLDKLKATCKSEKEFEELA